MNVVKDVDYPTRFTIQDMYSFQTPYGLSNSGQEKLQFTPFWGGHKPGCSDGLRAGIIEAITFLS